MKPRFWETLGIEPTIDQRAIRKAYGGQLKSIDVDAEPASFIALRQARDAALAWSADPHDYQQEEIEEGPDEDLDPLADERDDDSIWARPEPEPPQRTGPWDEDDPDSDIARLHELLFSDSPEDDLHAKVRRATEKLLGHAALDEIGRAEAVERWMADAIVVGIPRSDAMIAPAMRRFGWPARAEAYDCPPAIFDVLDRYRDCLFRNRIHADDSADSRVLKALTAPPPAHAGILLPIRVRAFLQAVRTRHPSVERDLDPESLAWWDEYLDRCRLSFPWPAALMLGAGLLLFDRVSGVSTLPPLLAVLASFGGAVLWTAIRHKIERRSTIDYDDELPAPSKSQWAAIIGLLALPVAALLTPLSAPAFLGFACAAGLLALFAGPSPPPSGEPMIDRIWQARLALLVPAAWLHAPLWIGPEWAQVFIPLCAASWTGLRHGERLREGILQEDKDNKLAKQLRGALMILGMILWVKLFSRMDAPADALLPLLLLTPVLLLIIHQVLDPPNPGQTEWKATSLIAVAAVVVGGPLAASLLVVWRSGRTVANLQAG